MKKKSDVINLNEARSLYKFAQEIKSLSLEKLLKETKSLEIQIEKKLTDHLLLRAKKLLKELERRSTDPTNLKNLNNKINKL